MSEFDQELTDLVNAVEAPEESVFFNDGKIRTEPFTPNMVNAVDDPVRYSLSSAPADNDEETAHLLSIRAYAVLGSIQSCHPDMSYQPFVVDRGVDKMHLTILASH